MFEAEFWVAVAFVVFLGVLGYVGAHTRLLKGIDDRRKRINSELDEARRRGCDVRCRFQGQAELAAFLSSAAKLTNCAKRFPGAAAPDFCHGGVS